VARDTEDDGCTVDSAVNDAGEEIPFRALLRVTGVDADGFVKVAKPDADGVFHCVNWKEPMPVGARGQVTFDARCVMLYDTAGGTPDPLAEWGAAAGSFYLTAGKKGVIPFGGIRSLTSPAGTGLVLAKRLTGNGSGVPWCLGPFLSGYTCVDNGDGTFTPTLTWSYAHWDGSTLTVNTTPCP
jgi:hypothetical protein